MSGTGSTEAQSVETTWRDEDSPDILDRNPLHPRIEKEPGEELIRPDSSGTSTIEPLLSRSSGETSYPAKILLCAKCEEYHEWKIDWDVCPKCSSDLVEVEKA